MKIPLIKSTFHDEEKTKEELCKFIKEAKKLSMGEECKTFEKKFSEFQERKHSLFVTSGSMANLVLIQALLNTKKITKGDKIGVSSLTWSTNIMPLLQLGLQPILLDCEKETLNTPLKEIEKEKELKAVFLTNALGFCSNIGEIETYCKEKNIILLEDNCESLGSEYNNKKLGNYGLASTFSFFVGHHLSTIEGGMICTDDEELYENMLITRIHGWARDLPEEKRKKLAEKHNIKTFYEQYTFYHQAFNARPTEINGFIGNKQLPHIKEIIRKREQNYKEILTTIKENKNLIPIENKNLTTTSNFGIPIIAKDKETQTKYLEKFKTAGIEIRPIISGNMEQQPFLKEHITIKGKPNAEFIHERGFYIGNNQELTTEEIKYIKTLLQQ